MSKNKLDPITRDAIDWVLHLESGRACSSERQVFKAWLTENPEHKAAWQRVAGLVKNSMADLQSVDRRSPGEMQAALKALLDTPSPARKKALQGAVLLLLLGLGTAVLVDRVVPFAGLMADQYTGTGERKTIELHDEPLSSLIDALRPYQTGVLRISPEAARLRVFGVFALDNTAHTLSALAQTLPLKVTRYGPWLTVIDVVR